MQVPGFLAFDVDVQLPLTLTKWTQGKEAVISSLTKKESHMNVQV